MSTGPTPQTTAPVAGSAVPSPNGPSAAPALSGDARYVAFSSRASNLVRGDSNGISDVFVRDVVSDRTSRISVSTSGSQGNGPSSGPSISNDGTVVAFISHATNLTAVPVEGAAHVFIRDIRAGTTEQVGAFRLGSTLYSPRAAVSGDGRHVAFATSSALVPQDINDRIDVYSFDRTTHAFELVSVSSSGALGTGHSYQPSISNSGRHIAFSSMATELYPDGREYSFPHVFVRDRALKTTTLVSPSGDPYGTYGDAASISGDGSRIAFTYGEQSQGGGRYSSMIGIWESATGEIVTVPRYGQEAAISNDGRVVTYRAVNRAVEPGETNPDLYPESRLGVSTFFVATRHWAKVANGAEPAISGTGRFVAYVRGGVVFLRDRTTGRTRIVTPPA